jgi:thymidine phosphorylase
MLGGGRRNLDDTLDLAVGLTDIVPIGTPVDADTPLAKVHAASRESAEQVATLMRKACRISWDAPAKRPVVCRTLHDARAAGRQPGPQPVS